MFEIDVASIPPEYWLCVILLVLTFIFVVRLRNELWAPPFIAVLGTVTAWYMVEPIYFEDFFYDFTSAAAGDAYRCLLVFLITLVAATPAMVRLFQPKLRTDDTSLRLQPDAVIPVIVGLWIVLLAFGIYRVEGDVIGALLPIEGRAGGNMWGRGAAEDAGATGFLVSTGAFLYVLVLSLFGLMLPLTRKAGLRVLLIACIVISWPYAFLQGSRNITLAVVVPGIACYLLISRAHPAMKFLVAIASFLLLDFAMKTIIEFRNVGFEAANFAEAEHAKHLGLNMASELTYITGFIQDGIMSISWGGGYLAEALNVIPRAIWPDKPLLGIDYAIARGFGGAQGDIGVVATLSTGIVGQGVLNFGLWFGPFVAGLLMSAWVGILTRLRYQGGAARIALFLIGLGLTFNLGRDITLLVLFPFLFGYIGVRILERYQRRKTMRDVLEGRALAVADRHLSTAAIGHYRR